MQRGRISALTSAVYLLQLLPLVFAHGHDEGSMEMGEVHGGSASELTPAPSSDMDVKAQPSSYFAYPEHASLMYAHIFLMTIAWFVVLPVGVMFSLARSRYTLPVQLSFLVFNAFGILTSVIYRHQVPNLYENNSHHKVGWAITWLASAWAVMGLVNLYARRRRKPTLPSNATHPVSVAAIARHEQLQEAQPAGIYRWSNDSGQGTERNSASLCGHSDRSPSIGSETQRFHETPQSPSFHNEEDDDEGEDMEKRGFLRNTSVDRFLSRNVPRVAFGRTLTAVRFLYALIDRFILVLGFVALTTGTVVYGGIFRGSNVFNGLAHFIKGGIFFGYGLLTLGRWMGCFADFGWAWNVKPSKEQVGRWKAALPSAEFTESFVIFLYGASNVFLEHLAAWGGAWTAQDLEHVSISVMFFGGGLLGMLIESRKIRDLLNTTILTSKDKQSHPSNEPWQAPRTYSFSMNPLPGLVILLLGLMMGSHHQASMISTMIHKQWGTMFVGFALVRAVTYLIMYLSPPTSFLPSRPPSEIIAAFCLIGGGLIFMESNKDTVAALERNGLDAMFVFTVTMGITALIMAWTTVVVAIKGWAVRRETASAFTQHGVGVLA